jgi:integrase
MAAATVNNHLASLSGWTSWVHTQAPGLFARGDPAKGIGELPLPPLEPRALSDAKVRSLKSLCDRLPRLHGLKGRRWHDQDEVPVRSSARPWRDRALVFLLLSTGLRREGGYRIVVSDLERGRPIWFGGQDPDSAESRPCKPADSVARTRLEIKVSVSRPLRISGWA